VSLARPLSIEIDVANIQRQSSDLHRRLVLSSSAENAVSEKSKLPPVSGMYPPRPRGGVVAGSHPSRHFAASSISVLFGAKWTLSRTFQ